MNASANFRVLVADDKDDVVKLVGSSLTQAGFDVLKAHDGAQALQMAHDPNPALVVLDVMMPKMSGTEVLRSLKANQRTAGIPVVMLTAHRDEINRVLAFELGADDYVTKPFSPRELTLRVKSILSRHNVHTPAATFFSNGRLTLDRERHEVAVGGKRVDVTAVEFRLLCALMQRAGRVLSRGDLINKAWGVDKDVEPGTVDTHLRRLRDKLGSAATQIQTVRGFGCRLSET